MDPGKKQGSLKRLLSIILLVILGTISLYSQINIRTYYLRGRQHLASHEFTQAIQYFNTILQYSPEHAEALFYRGLAKYQLSDYSGAEADFTRSIDIKPYKTEALYYRALMKLERSQYLDAFRDVQKAIELDDRHPEYFITRGWLHLEYSDTTGAISDYKKAIELDPALDNAHLNLSTIYLQQGKYELALNHCDTAESINPYNPASHLTRGKIFQRQKKYADAIIQYQIVLREDSMSVHAWFLTAICHQGLGAYEPAMEAYNRTIELNKNNALGYYNRGLLQLENGKNREALADFDQVVILSPKNIYAYYLRGIIKTRMEDFSGAEEDFSAAIDLYPNLIHAYRDRSITRMAQNDLKGYTEDKNTVDSLLNIKVPGFDLSEISYLKTITDFNADFTPVERVQKSKVQYSDEGVSMLAMFHISLRPDQYDQSYHRVKDLQLPWPEYMSRHMLEFKNFENNMPDENTNRYIEGLIRLLPEDPEDPNDILIKSLVLGWQMKYRNAIELLDSSHAELSGNYLAAFNRGNYNLSIAEIISSIEIQDIYSSDDNSTLERYHLEALKDYNTSIARNSDFIFSRFNRAIVYSLTEELDKAIEDYSWCTENEPDFGEAYYNMGLLKVFMNNPSAGCQDLSKAGELGIQSAYQIIYKFCKDE